ncbi:MAG: hypothetical protein GY839_07210 [candidate division Zixibacteria bacterium]|nr:hypothetical protein [candidate division Zixibacteria bacterium]
MKAMRLFMCVSAVLLADKAAMAGEFYKLYPQWLEYSYHLLSLGLIATSLGVSYSIYRNLKGGQLSVPWVIILIALFVIFIRTVFSILTIFDVQFFQAIAFAGLDILFFILLLIGLILYKVGLN